MTCEKTQFVHLYFDHELDAMAASAFEAHLAGCEECRRLLEELQGLSRFISQAEMPALPGRALQRVRAAWRANRDRSILRIASWATAAAAAILFASLLFVPGRNAPSAPRAQMWEAAAVMPPDPQGESGSEVVQVAQWIVRDLSSGEGR